MKKYIQSMMAFAAIVSFASCSSEDNTTIENESAAKLMTFTATQEGNEASTKATLSGFNIYWESGDKISLLYDSENKQLSLTGGAESTSGKFSGEAEQSNSYTAVYPYQASATLSGSNVTNVNLPAKQTPTDNSFDKSAALMMAQSGNTTLEFKNAVGYVKVTPNFACKKIELKAADGDVALAGTGTLTWNEGNPKIELTEDQPNTITLEGNMTAGTAYYIAVPAVSLKRMWSISFTTSDGTKVYTRKGAKPIEFQRSKIINLGEFNTGDDYWYDEQRGIVKASQEVYMGDFKIGVKTYQVFFAKSNLTATGLAAKESDFGDYFAFAATEPWCTEYNRTGTGYDVTVTPKTWANTQNASTYDWSTTPYTNGSSESCSKYKEDNSVLRMEDDAARQILGGEWQLPTIEIWNQLRTNYNWGWTTINDYYGRKVTSRSDGTRAIFLPAAGSVNGTNFNVNPKGELGFYWSSTAKSYEKACFLKFKTNQTQQYVTTTLFEGRYYGYPVRPVRLVEVSQPQQ